MQFKTGVTLGGVIALAICLLQTGCGKGASGGGGDTAKKIAIQVKGSDTMVNVA